MARFNFLTTLTVQTAGGNEARIPEGPWPVTVSGVSVRVQVAEGVVELDLDQWDSILRDGLAQPAPG